MSKRFLAVLLMFNSPVMADDVMMQPGLWKTKVVHQTTDGQDTTGQTAMLRQTFANMPPDQRKKFEAAMTGNGMFPFDADGNTLMCVSAAMAARDGALVDPMGKCPLIKRNRNGKELTWEASCDAEGGSAVGKGAATVTGTSVTSNVDMTATTKQGQHKIHIDSQMTLVSADCKGIRPADEFGKDNPRPVRP